MRWLLSCLIATCLVFSEYAAQAQQTAYPLQPPPSGIATLDRERLFQESNFGQQKLAQIEAESRALASENRQIEQKLEAEEQELTDLRSEIDAVTFQKRAIDFDVKVKQTRSEQEAKLSAIRADLDQAQQEFAELTDPLIKQLMADLGIAVIVNKTAVLYATTDIDITDDAILQVNQLN